MCVLLEVMIVYRSILLRSSDVISVTSEASTAPAELHLSLLHTQISANQTKRTEFMNTT